MVAGKTGEPPDTDHDWHQLSNDILAEDDGAWGRITRATIGGRIADHSLAVRLDGALGTRREKLMLGGPQVVPVWTEYKDVNLR